MDYKSVLSLIDEAVYNNFVLYKINNNDNKSSYLDFRIEIGRSLLNYETRKPGTLPRKFGRHYPENIPPTEYNWNPCK